MPQLSRPVKCTEKGIEWYDSLTNTFNLKEMPSEIKNIIKQIGYKKRDLLRADKAKPIFEIIQKFGLDQAKEEDEQEDFKEEFERAAQDPGQEEENAYFGSTRQQHVASKSSGFSSFHQPLRFQSSLHNKHTGGRSDSHQEVAVLAN